MAGRVAGTLTGLLRADARGFTATIQQARQQVGVLGKDFADLRREGGNVTAGLRGMVAEFRNLAALAGVSVGIGAIARATLEQAQATERLRVALAAQGPEAEKALDGLTAYANELSRFSGIDDDVIVGLEATLAQFRAQPEIIPQATRAVLNYATATGKDATGAILSLQDSVRDGTLNLGKFGTITLQASGQTERFTEAIDILGRRIPDVLQAGSRGLPGLVNAFRNGVDDILAEIGRLTVAVIFPDVDGRRIADFLEGIRQQIEDVGKSDAFGDLRESVRGFRDAVGELVALLSGGLGPAAQFTVGVLQGFADSLTVAAATVSRLLQALGLLPDEATDGAGSLAGLAGKILGVVLAGRLLFGAISPLLGILGRLGGFLGTAADFAAATGSSLTGLRLAFAFATEGATATGGVLARLIALFPRLLAALNPFTLAIGGLTTVFTVGVEAAAAYFENSGRAASAAAARTSAALASNVNVIQDLRRATQESGRAGFEFLTVQDLLASKIQVSGDAIRNYAVQGRQAQVFSTEYAAVLFRLGDELDAARSAQVDLNRAQDVADPKRLEEEYEKLLKSVVALEDGVANLNKTQREANETALEASGAVLQAASLRADREIEEAERVFDARVVGLERDLEETRAQQRALEALGEEGRERANSIAVRADTIEARLQVAKEGRERFLSDLRVAGILKAGEVAARLNEENIKREADLAARRTKSDEDLADAGRERLAVEAALTAGVVDDAEQARDAAIARLETEHAIAAAAAATTASLAIQAEIQAQRNLDNARASGATESQLAVLQSRINDAGFAAEAARAEQARIADVFGVRITTARIEGNRRVAEAEIEESRRLVEQRISTATAGARREASARIAQGRLSTATLEAIERERDDRIAQARVEALSDEQTAITEEIERRRSVGEAVGVLMERQAEIGRELDEAQTTLLDRQGEAVRAAVAAQEEAVGRLRDAFNVAFLDAEGRLRSFEDIWTDIWNNITDTTLGIINDQISVAIRGALDLSTPGERTVAAGGATPGPGAALGREAGAGVPAGGGGSDIFSSILGSLLGPVETTAAAAGERSAAAGQVVASGVDTGTAAIEDASTKGAGLADAGLGQLGTSLLGSISGLVGGLGKGVSGLLGGITQGFAGLLGPLGFLAGPLIETGIGALTGALFGKKKKGTAETSTTATQVGTGSTRAAATFFQAAETAATAGTRLPSFTPAAAGAGIVQTVNVPFNIQIVTPTSEAADAVRDQVRVLMPEITGIVARETERLRTQAEEGIPRRLALSSV